MNRFESVTKRLMLFAAFLLVAVAAGCGGGGGGRDPILGGGGTGGVVTIPGAPPGAIPPGTACTVVTGPTIPTVTSSDPSDGNQFATTSTSGVAGGGKLVTATFSLPMNGATLTSTTFTLAQVGQPVLTGTTVAYDSATRTASLKTSSALLPGTSYTAIITQGAVTAADGTPLSCTYAWNFKTVTPAATGLAPVNMGSAAPFGISATAGLATAVSSSTVNADVLLDPLAQCNATAVDTAGGIGTCAAIGFPPSIVGTVISTQFTGGRNIATIRNDLNAAYLSITPPAGPPAAGGLAGGVVIGAPSAGIGGLTGTPCVYNINAGNCFTPGVYTAASTITVTGDLTLDAQGDQNAMFVFQAGSTIGTAAGAAPPGVRTRILLINGAKASNVWWQAGTSATVGTYGEFQGNILAAASVTLNNGATSCGRMMAGSWVGGGGAITLGGANVVAVPGQPFAPPAGYSTTCQ